MKPRQCEGCGIIERGKLCNEILKEYREHLICISCRKDWQAMEKKKGREVKFLESKLRGEKMPRGVKV